MAAAKKTAQAKTPEIKKAAVIGAGVMGAGIAAHMANAGIEVVLLDIAAKDNADRSAIAKGAVDKLLKSNPAALMHPTFAKRITPGNIDDDLHLLKTCDWVVEAVVERLDIKHSLYEKVFQLAGKNTLVSSNTSTLPLKRLSEKLTDKQKERFMITHFFNPPRYLRLLEVVTPKTYNKPLVNAVRAFCDENMGKTVVDAKDTPGFIANRIGTYWLLAGVNKAVEHGVDVETADLVLGKPAGVPRTGIFGLLDLVGLDLMPHILHSLAEALDEEDMFNQLGSAPALLQKMIAEGYTGRKGKGGFYRLNTEGGKKAKEVLNLQSGSYEAARKDKTALTPFQKHGLRGLLEDDSPAGRYAWDVLSHTLIYAASLVPDIARDPAAVDEAMRRGFNWKYGPFELMDKLGTDWLIGRLRAEGRFVPALLDRARGAAFYKVADGQLQVLNPRGGYSPVKRGKGVLLLEDIKRTQKPLATNFSASLWDIGKGVVCLEFHSKMNSLDPFTLAMLKKALHLIPQQGYKGLVIYNEAEHFSVGANVGMLLLGTKLRLWFAIRKILSMGQFGFEDMKFANFPVVGAPSGMALGGGCEVLLHCDAIEAHAESYIGLVEAGVGIIPGWGGCKEMLLRAKAAADKPKGPMAIAQQVFETIAVAKVAKSAYEAQELLFLRKHDGITMNRDRLLYNARERVVKLAKNYTSPQPQTLTLPGPSGKVALNMGVEGFAKRGLATPHDVTIANELAICLTGGNKDVTETHSETDILRAERDGILRLCKTPQTRARIVHILKTGKPLRN